MKTRTPGAIKKIRKFIARSLPENEENGQSLIEYTLVLVLVVLTIAAIYNFTQIQIALTAALERVASSI